MSIKKFLTVCAVIGVLALSAHTSAASVVPTLSLTSQSDTAVSVHVTGDPNSTITLSYYSSTSGLSYMTLGSTDGSGNFSATVDPLTYNMKVGQPAAVLVDGQISTNIMWPTAGTTASTPAASTLNVLPLLSSITITSSNANGGFLGAGSVINISFSSTQALQNPSVTLAGQSLSTNGIANGPYTASYTTRGTEGSSAPLTISLPNAAGAMNQVSFAIGSTGIAAGQSTPITVPPPTIPSTASTGLYVFNNPLTIGMTNAEVKALQQRLTTLGFFTGPLSGFYGAQTEAAVEAYQTKHNLTPLGNVGPNTRALLNSGL